MSYPYQPQPPGQPYETLPPQPGPPKKKWPIVVGIIGAALIGMVVLGGILLAVDRFAQSESTPGADTTATTSEEAVEPETVAENVPDPEPATFAPDDFEMKVKTLSKECFGSAGCLIEYRVVPTYLGVESDLDSASVEITYKVTGGSDGPQIGTFMLEAGQYDIYELEGYTDISSSGKLKAKITEVVTY